ncbi:hypothetical protein OGY35_23770 [Citrobacter sp. Ct235]|uniref:hypothetical protein n=1 Tax=Citrobacter sp. Ct235 TaxID=2985157 RepID=UPI0025780B1F|nr:hypothetical protein [Citrobacter sp. Ct235]MDM2738374.1 hypothetical protein [Citrobacter sp. Ct235]
MIRVLILILLLCGCADKPIIVQETLLQECTKNTPLPEDGSGKSSLNTLIEWDKLYERCRILHHNLIEAVRNKQ